MISTPTVVPAAPAGTASGAAHGARTKGVDSSLFSSLAGSTFASVLNAKSVLAAATQSSSAAPTANSADLLAQLTALLKNGTPLATIINRIAQSVGSSVANLLSAKYAPSDVDRIQNSITQTIANALSPPNTGPPGTAAEQAAALAARLQKVVESLAREAQDGSGQQNELSGNILDAFTAKELPAQQKTNGTPSTLDVSSVVSSLLTSAISALKASNAAVASAPPASPLPALSSSVTSNPAIVQGAIQPASGDSSDSSPVQTGLLAQSTANAVASSQGSAQTPAISISNAPDLLARILVRAAGVDAQINGSSASPNDASDAAAGASSAVASAGTPPLTPAALAARFTALLAEIDSRGAISESSGNASTNGNTSHGFEQELAQRAPSDSTVLTNLLSAPATPNLTSQGQNAVQAPPGPAGQFDANAVLEQLLQGISIRTLQQGTSEIRLQLQPENLGPLTIRLSVSGTQVSANIVAQSVDVKNALVSNHQDLARSLSQAGLTLSGFSVDVSGGDAGRDQNRDHTPGFGRRYTVHELGGNATSDTTEASDLGPPLLGGSSLELLNYLA
jgi:flagellar hook-length control protein FliK